jgi:hypothetical protein
LVAKVAIIGRNGKKRKRKVGLSRKKLVTLHPKTAKNSK